MAKSHEEQALAQLGARWSPDFDGYASGEIGLSEVRCLLCEQAPCACQRCSVAGCGFTVPPGQTCPRRHQ
jgi:hypothetical protein